MDLKEIRALIDLMTKNGIAVFKMERDNFRITLKTSHGMPSATSVLSPPHHAHPSSIPPALKASENAIPSAADGGETAGEKGKEITSPMVGTFYLAPSPEAPPFVEVGKQITPETVVCIVEAMKVMNEIKAETSGTITEIVARDGEPVQFGQVLFRLK